MMIEEIFKNMFLWYNILVFLFIMKNFMKKSPLGVASALLVTMILSTAVPAFARNSEHHEDNNSGQEMMHGEKSASGSLLCSQDATATSAKIEERKAKMDDRFDDMKAKMDDSKQEREKEMKSGEGEKALKKYKSSASFDQVKYDAALVTIKSAKDLFKTTVDTAKATRKTSTDAAREAFKVSADTAYATLSASYCTTTDSAMKKSLKDAFKTSMDSARTVRNTAVKAAQEQFKSEAKAAKDALKVSIDNALATLK